MNPWNPPVEPTKRESAILRRLDRTRKLFKFLRLHRHEIFSDEFQAELGAMYRKSSPRPVLAVLASRGRLAQDWATCA